MLPGISPAQNIGINTTGELPNASSMLDVSAANKGLLIPRVSLSSTTDNTTIASPATSLLVYNTNATITGAGANGTGFYYWNGSLWVNLMTYGAVEEDADWYRTGTTSPPGSIGDSMFHTGFVSIGTDNPDRPLRVLSSGKDTAVVITNSTNANLGKAGIKVDMKDAGNGDATGFDALLQGSSPFSKTAYNAALLNNVSDTFQSNTGYSVTVTGTGTADEVGFNFDSQNEYSVSRIGVKTNFRLSDFFHSRRTVAMENTFGPGMYGFNTGIKNNFTTGSGNPSITGVSNVFEGTYATARGMMNDVRITGAVTFYGVVNRFSTKSGIGFINQYVESNPSGVQWGYYNLYQGRSNSRQGYTNEYSGTDSSNFIGYANIVGNSGTGNKWGLYNQFTGVGNAQIVGGYTNIQNSGNGNHYGFYANLNSAGTGQKFGLATYIAGNGGSHFGLSAIMLGNTPAQVYGVSSVIGATGSGDHFGLHDTVYVSAAGRNFGVYSVALDTANDYAGYYLGKFSLGMDSANNYVFPTTRGTNKQLLQTDAVGKVSWVDPGAALSSVGWLTTGNAGTVDGTNFLGTTDNVPLNFRVNNQKAGRIDGTNANAAYGYQAGNALTSGVGNSLYGQQAGLSLTTGSNNIFVGQQAGLSNTTASANVGVGMQALFSNTTGGQNTAIGYSTMYSNTTGISNTAIGNNTLQFNTTGSENLAAGSSAALFNTIGSNNVALGALSLYNNLSSGDNVAVGHSALSQMAYNPGISWTAGNVALGYRALYSTNSTTVSNGILNVATGYQSLQANTTGQNNTASGSVSLYSNTTGQANAAFGDSALYLTTTSSNVTALGSRSLRNNVSSDITAVGSLAMYANTTGTLNTSVGYSSMSSNTTGDANTALGYQAMLNNTTGGRNVAVGTSALQSQSYNNAGIDWISGNVAVGYSALYSVNSTISTNGVNNTALGYLAGDGVTTGSNNTLLGRSADLGTTALNYATAIGSGATVNCSNCMVLGGNTAVTQTRVGINTSLPTFFLDLEFPTGIGNGLGIRNTSQATGWELYQSGTFGVPYFWFNYNGLNMAQINSTSGAYVQVSDKRFKTNIKPVGTVLDKVMKLKPSRYQYIRNNPNSLQSIGFIAQEVEPYFPEMVSKQLSDDPDAELKEFYTMDYAGMSVIAIRAIQEQQQLIEQQKQENVKQQQTIDDLKKKIEILEQKLK